MKYKRIVEIRNDILQHDPHFKMSYNILLNDIIKDNVNMNQVL